LLTGAAGFAFNAGAGAAFLLEGFALGATRARAVVFAGLAGAEALDFVLEAVFVELFVAMANSSVESGFKRVKPHGSPNSLSE
jgi:hypothetical protein